MKQSQRRTTNHHERYLIATDSVIAITLFGRSRNKHFPRSVVGSSVLSPNKSLFSPVIICFCSKQSAIKAPEWFSLSGVYFHKNLFISGSRGQNLGKTPSTTSLMLHTFSGYSYHLSSEVTTFNS